MRGPVRAVAFGALMAAVLLSAGGCVRVSAVPLDRLRTRSRVLSTETTVPPAREHDADRLHARAAPLQLRPPLPPPGDEVKVDARKQFTIMAWNVRNFAQRCEYGGPKGVPDDAFGKATKYGVYGGLPEGQKAWKVADNSQIWLEHDLYSILKTFATTDSAYVLVLQEAYHMRDLVAAIIAKEFKDKLTSGVASGVPTGKLEDKYMTVVLLFVTKLQKDVAVTCEGKTVFTNIYRQALCKVEMTDEWVKNGYPKEWLFYAVHADRELSADKWVNAFSPDKLGVGVVVGDLNQSPESLQKAFGDYGVSVAKADKPTCHFMEGYPKRPVGYFFDAAARATPGGAITTPMDAAIKVLCEWKHESDHDAIRLDIGTKWFVKK